MGKKSGGKRDWNNDDEQFSKFDKFQDFAEFIDINGLEEFEDFGNEEEYREFENYDGFSMYPLDSSFLKPEKFKNKGTFESPENKQMNNKPKKNQRKKK